MDDLNVDDELYSLVCQGDLENELDTRLKTLPNVDNNLKLLYQRGNQHVNLLMLAALHGHDAIVRIILSHSSNVKNLVELTGNVISINGTLVFNATALWCACDQGQYTVARTLIEVGKASTSRGPGNPLLIDAIINERLDTIYFLIENDYVDIDQTRANNHPKYNSLMLSAARGQIKIVAYLLEKGVNVDYTTSTYHDTALGCAAMEGHLDTVQLLCSAGACCTVKNSNEETPLTLAFKNDHSHIVDYLLDLTGNETCMDELELAASSVIVPVQDSNTDQLQFEKMVNLMRKIFKLRKVRNTPKTVMVPIAAYNFQQECQTIEEFEKIQHDNDRLCIEALLIRERILTPMKTIILCDPLLVYGERLIEQGKFELCLYLWEHTFHLYQNMNHETSLHRLVWVFCKMLVAKVPISSQQFLQICRLAFEPSQQNKKNHTIKNGLCFVTIAVKVLEQPTLTKLERKSIYQWINDLCRQQRTTSDQQTLLHLCVNDQTYRDINYRPPTQLLLTYGNRWIDIDATELLDGNTALHIVSQSNNIDALSVVKYLINTGAHIDCVNKHNKTPFDCAKTNEIKTVLQKQQTPLLLKCLCARYIVAQQINYEVIWPTETKLNAFIFLHGCIAKKNHAV